MAGDMSTEMDAKDVPPKNTKRSVIGKFKKHYDKMQQMKKDMNHG